MKRFYLGVAAIAALSACSGSNPFAAGDTVVDGEVLAIPAELTSDLEGVTYNPVNQTLTVRSLSIDSEQFAGVYNRRPALDRGGYEAYTKQDGSLRPHSTAYVRQIDGTSGGIAATGGQFQYYFAGGTFGRNGAYDPPDAGSVGGQVVTYAGNYVGLMNIAGDGGDLLPVTPGTPPDVRPVQAAEVTGRVQINADFVDNVTNGLVYNRVIVDGGPALSNLELAPTDIDPTNGTFVGDVTVNLRDRGAYGGVFGGNDGSAVAGTLFAKDHVDGITEEEEYGLFVLAQCGTPNADPICNQPNP